MRMKLGLIAASLLTIATVAFAGEDGNLLQLGRYYVKTGQLEFAYMQFRGIVVQYPDSPYREEAFFATGEYFAKLANYKEAQIYFEQFLKEYPSSKYKIFALAYLYKIAETSDDAPAMEKLKNDIVTFHQVGLIFRDSKVFKQKSPLHRMHRAVIQIDKITIYCEGEILAEIPY